MGTNEVIYSYKGKPLENLSHEELLIAAKWAIDALNQERKSHRESLDMEKLFEDVRQRLR